MLNFLLCPVYKWLKSKLEKKKINENKKKERGKSAMASIRHVSPAACNCIEVVCVFAASNLLL